MKIKRCLCFYFFTFSAFVLTSVTCPAQVPLSVNTLRCEYRDHPTGIEKANPALSWQLSSLDNGKRQSAYQVLVASSPDKLHAGETDLWNSAKVMSGQSVHVTYQGQVLEPRQRCYWKVRVWDEQGRVSPWSELAYWEMGLINEDEWQARWIRHPDFLDTLLEAKPAPYFRKVFELSKPVSKARAYVTGLGYFDMEINGRKIGDDILAPAKTAYDKTVSYVIHDISNHLRDGRNAVGLVLGTGWYNHFAQSAWDFDEAPWRAYPEMRCQIEITYTDSSREVIISDQSWTCSQGPIRYDGIRNGEHYDARLEMPGWSTPAFNAEGWKSAVEVKGPAGKMKAQQLPPIRATQEIRPVSIEEVKEGVYVFDFGQNIAGYCRLRVAGPEGTKMSLKHGEKLHPDGTVKQMQILRFLKTGEAQTDQYILKGEGVEEWQPRFVYHGFQYVEVSGLPVAPTPETLTGIVLHTDFEKAGQFQCSDPLFNRIQENMHWSFIGNYHGLPTDCPHREKIGWTGDGHLVAETGLLNYDIISSYAKWMDDFVDAQRDDGLIPAIVPSSGWGYMEKQQKSAQNPGPQWRGAVAIIPWQMYRYTGDTSLLARYYPAVRKYVNYLYDIAGERNLLTHGIDDHKAPGNKTEGDILASAYYFHLTRRTADMAKVLGKQQDHDKMILRAEQIKNAYQEKYFNEAESIYGNGGQTALSMSLALDLVPEAEQAEVSKQLLARIADHDYFFDVGVVGMKCLYDALGDRQQSESIYRMLSQRAFPSYGWWIEQGANTLWQDWDGSMSHNHIMFGSVSEWFYQSLAGINPDDQQPGFKLINFRPEFIEGLDWVSAEHESLYGTIKAAWERQDNQNEVVVRLKVPVNSRALFFVPDGYALSEGQNERQLSLVSGDHRLRLIRQP